MARAAAPGAHGGVVAVLAVGLLLGCLFLYSSSPRAPSRRRSTSCQQPHRLWLHRQRLGARRQHARGQTTIRAGGAGRTDDDGGAVAHQPLPNQGCVAERLLFVIYMLAMCVFRRRCARSGPRQGKHDRHQGSALVGFPLSCWQRKYRWCSTFCTACRHRHRQLELGHFVGGASTFVTASSSYADALNVTVALNLTSAEVPGQYEKWVPGAGPSTSSAYCGRSNRSRTLAGRR